MNTPATYKTETAAARLLLLCTNIIVDTQLLIDAAVPVLNWHLLSIPGVDYSY